MINDNVNHPRHYKRDNAMECIDEIEMLLSFEQFYGYCLGNVMKYRYRAADKNGEEDLKKSDWYMKKLKETYGKRKQQYSE